jgi:hypothetical protein
VDPVETLNDNFIFTEKRDPQEMKRRVEEVSKDTDDIVSTMEKEQVERASTAVQSHGFSWEKEIMSRVYGATLEEQKCIPYTSKIDLPAEINRLDPCDISIKTSCHSHMVCMADCLRVYDSVCSDRPIHLVVLHYLQEADTKKIISIIEIDLTDSCEALFGSLTRADIETLDRAVKAVPQKKKPTEEEHTSMYAIRDALQKMSRAIHLDIKCNSTQSRLQCSFNHFQKFLERKKQKTTTIK